MGWGSRGARGLGGVWVRVGGGVELGWGEGGRRVVGRGKFKFLEV